MLSCVIVDDEYRGREVLASLLAMHCPEVTVSGMARNVSTAYEMICRTRPHLVFLDIEMPDGSGFDLLNKFPEREFRTVFVSSYDQYAIQAFRFQAFDYLLKPVIVEELKATIKHVLEQQGIPYQKTQVQETVLEINNKTKLEYVRLDEILMLKGDGNYTHIYTIHGKTFHTSRILKEYEDILCRSESAFVRTHKSSIINLAYAKTFEHGTLQGLAMANGTIVEVSRRKKEEVLQKMKRYRAQITGTKK